MMTVKRYNKDKSFIEMSTDLVNVGNFYDYFHNIPFILIWVHEVETVYIEVKILYVSYIKKSLFNFTLIL